MKDTPDIKDYLHLYLGCGVEVDRTGWNSTKVKGVLVGINKATNDMELTWYSCVYNNGTTNKHHTVEIIKPILRPLSDMTEEEKSVSDKFNVTSNLELAEWFRYLLSKHFDLFGLIEAGLAIDKAKIVNHGQDI